MNEESKTRVKRTTEERVAEIDAKIAMYEQRIAKLNQKKEEIINPPITTTMNDIKTAIKEHKIPLDKVMKAIEKMIPKED